MPWCHRYLDTWAHHQLVRWLGQTISSSRANLIVSNGTLNVVVTEFPTNLRLTRAFMSCFAATRRSSQRGMLSMSTCMWLKSPCLSPSSTILATVCARRAVSGTAVGVVPKDVHAVATIKMERTTRLVGEGNAQPVGHEGSGECFSLNFPSAPSRDGFLGVISGPGDLKSGTQGR